MVAKLFLVVMVFVVSCGEMEEIVWEDPMIEPEGWESPYDTQCQEVDYAGYDHAAESEAYSMLPMGQDPRCLRPHDGLGGTSRWCANNEGADVGRLANVCGPLRDDAIPCVMYIVSSEADGVCMYEPVCIPEHRWEEIYELPFDEIIERVC